MKIEIHQKESKLHLMFEHEDTYRVVWYNATKEFDEENIIVINGVEVSAEDVNNIALDVINRLEERNNDTIIDNYIQDNIFNFTKQLSEAISNSECFNNFAYHIEMNLAVGEDDYGSGCLVYGGEK